ncbi:hypothetical protein G9A89_007693 [Geosiphon pyriformis]|nr:hypothetical protein G9A89_007693 [Geosiphon pyriformis]
MNQTVYKIDLKGTCTFYKLLAQQDRTIILSNLCIYNNTYQYSFLKFTPDGTASLNNYNAYRDKRGQRSVDILNSNYLLVTSYDQQRRKLFLWNGTLIQRFFDVDLIKDSNVIDCRLTRNIQQDKNFLKTCRIELNSSEIEWIVFNAPTYSNENIKPISGPKMLEKLELKESFVDYSTFATIDGGFGLAYLAKFGLNTNITTYSVYVTFWEPETADFGPHLLLHQNDENATWIDCDAQINAVGYYCRLSNSQISFLRSGAVLKYITKEFSADSTTTISLAYGGLLNKTLIVKDVVFAIELYDQNGVKNDSWNISHLDEGYLSTILSNNTFWAATFDVNKVIVYTKNLPFFSKKDTRYENPFIITTYPRLNEKIPFGAREITINYFVEIAFSNNNISIYQNNETEPILRQSISAKSQYCHVEMDNRTIRVDVFGSTFNQPDKDYFIVVNNNFVKDAQYNEAIKGINRNIWQFKTATLIGLLRLNTNFSDFNKIKNEREVFKTLEDQLSFTIPVERSRIKIIDHKTDKSKSESVGREILRLQISSTSDSRNPMEIAHDLNALIENKWFTPISTYSHTGFLDETFGFQVKRLAGYIIINEISMNSEYVVWFRQFGKPAALFTILSAADIDALNLLHSKYANLGLFSAPISKRLEDLIFWGSTINIFIEDIPQFVIQV